LQERAYVSPRIDRQAISSVFEEMNHES